MPAPHATPEFKRELGLLDAVVVVAGGVVGVGIFANPSNVARILGDPALIVLAWAAGGLIALLAGFIWAELGSRFPRVGGQYVYLQQAYHPIVGFLYGVALLFIINGGAIAAISILFASYVNRIFVPLGGVGVRLVAALVLVVLTAVNIAGVRAGARTNNLLMLAKVGGILTLIALAVGRGTAPASHFDFGRAIGERASFGSLFTALVPILFAYSGWHSCASIAGEIKRPERNLPLANIFGMALVVALYVSINVAYLWVLTPTQMAASTALAADVAAAVAGSAGARLVSALILVSSLGILAVLILTGPRLYFAMANDGLLIHRAGILHPTHRTPAFALGLQTAVAIALLATNTYEQLLSYVVFAGWLFAGLTAGALIIVRRRDPAPHPHVASMPGHPVTTALFVAVCAVVVISSIVAHPTQSLIGAAILAAAAIVYALTVGRRQPRRNAVPASVAP